MSIKDKLKEMSFCQAHAISQEESERLRRAIDVAKKIFRGNHHEGLTDMKIKTATARVQVLCPSVDWKVAVTEAVNEYYKDEKHGK